MNYDLLTRSIFDRLVNNGRATAEAMATGREQPDHWPVVKLFNPCGAATWLLSEIDPEDYSIAFGLCDLGMDCAELGSVSLTELRSIRVGFGPGAPSLRIERDLHWDAIYPLRIYAKAGWKAGRIIFDVTSLDAAAKEVGL